MVHRTAPNCPKCGKAYKGIYADRGSNFIGDTFQGWDLHGHVCEQPAPAEDDKEYRDFVRAHLNILEAHSFFSYEVVESEDPNAAKEVHAKRLRHLTCLIADIKKGMEQGEANKPIIDKGSGIDARFIEAATAYSNAYGDRKNNAKLFTTFIDGAAFAYNLPAPTPADLTAWQQQKKGGGQ